MYRKSKYGSLVCRVTDCTKLAHSREVCSSHYNRWLRGDSSISPFIAPSARHKEPTPPSVRFWKFVTPCDGCWDWQGSVQSGGYGQIYSSDGPLLAHRLSYEMHVGEIPPGLSIDHLCRNRICVNPDHLEPVTLAENTLRAAPFMPQRRKVTHCKHGHEFTAENTMLSKDGNRRQCRECSRRRSREWKQRNRRKTS